MSSFIGTRRLIRRRLLFSFRFFISHLASNALRRVRCRRRDRMAFATDISKFQVQRSEAMNNNRQSGCPDELNQYLNLGYRLFPCNSDKKPITQHGFKDATSDIEQIERWSRQHPGCNWAL